MIVNCIIALTFASLTFSLMLLVANIVYIKLVTPQNEENQWTTAVHEILIDQNLKSASSMSSSWDQFCEIGGD